MASIKHNKQQEQIMQVDFFFKKKTVMIEVDDPLRIQSDLFNGFKDKVGGK